MNKETTEQGREEKPEWQLCPKCNGDGNLARYNSPSIISTDAALLCDVCQGAKILARPSTPSPLSSTGVDVKEAARQYVKDQGTIDRPDLVEIDFTNGFKAGYAASSSEGEERKFSLKEALEIWQACHNHIEEIQEYPYGKRKEYKHPHKQQYFKEKFGIDI